MKKLIALLLISSQVQAASFMKLNDFYLDVYKVADNQRVHQVELLPGEDWSQGTSANYSLDLIRTEKYRMRWDNKVHGEATNKQFRQVGWQYDLSIGTGRIDIFHSHHSQHLMDMDNGGGQQGLMAFPLENRYGIRIHFMP
jgi:hypothetical protein